MAWSERKSEIYATQDHCLIAITDGNKDVLIREITMLPPWRAVMIARVAQKAGLLDDVFVDNIVAEARAVSGDGELEPINVA